MRDRKVRITVTVDRELVEAGNQAVAAGRTDSLSGWVSRALAERVAKEQRLEALSKAVASYEAEFGVITAEEVAAQRRADEKNAVVIRGKKRAGASPRKLLARRKKGH